MTEGAESEHTGPLLGRINYCAQRRNRVKIYPSLRTAECIIARAVAIRERDTRGQRWTRHGLRVPIRPI